MNSLCRLNSRYHDTWMATPLAPQLMVGHTSSATTHGWPHLQRHYPWLATSPSSTAVSMESAGDVGRFTGRMRRLVSECRAAGGTVVTSRPTDNMSVAPFLLPRPVYTLSNSLVLPIVNQKQEETVLAFVSVVLPINILLDSFLLDVLDGRSYSEDLAGVYGVVSGRLAGQFGVDGQACILRFICQLQQRPIARWSLAGHLLTILFTPRLGGKDGDLDLLKEYLAAQILGRKENTDCISLYDTCPFSVFEYFDTLRNMTSVFSARDQNM
ncbi:uncharacterized protein [Panulirus ornatus]|uniref:uncharacterized protein n=1 Tax=Panulirus ornatus TaxID=150431 RepID=UPI003A884856